MHLSPDLAARLLRLEQQLQAYQRLHGEELAELWRGLNECKRELTDALGDERTNGSFLVKSTDEGRKAPEDERRQRAETRDPNQV